MPEDSKKVHIDTEQEILAKDLSAVNHKYKDLSLKIEKRLELLADNEKRWKAFEAKMERPSSVEDSRVRFDVGGEIFSTSRETVMKCHPCFLTTGIMGIPGSAGVPTSVFKVEVNDGKLNYDQCKALAEDHGGRLPTQAEVDKHLISLGFKPLFDQDMWWPVSDGDNNWVSVGNYDPVNRLGRSHYELFGPPGWGPKNDYVSERTKIAIVVLQNTQGGDGKTATHVNEDGSYFIDRDPLVFGRILNYLRNGEVDVLELSTRGRDMLKSDMEFYGIALPEKMKTPPLFWDPTKKPDVCTLSEENLTAVKGGGDTWNCSILSNIKVDRFTVRVNNRGSAGNIMVGFAKGEPWNINSANYSGSNGWFFYLINGTIYGNGASGSAFSGSVANGDFVTIIHEGTQMKVEKNKVLLGTCNFPTPLLNEPLYAALDIYDNNSSLTLVNDY